MPWIKSSSLVVNIAGVSTTIVQTNEKCGEVLTLYRAFERIDAATHLIHCDTDRKKGQIPSALRSQLCPLPRHDKAIQLTPGSDLTVHIVKSCLELSQNGVYPINKFDVGTRFRVLSRCFTCLSSFGFVICVAEEDAAEATEDVVVAADAVVEALSFVEVIVNGDDVATRAVVLNMVWGRGGREEGANESMLFSRGPNVRVEMIY